MRDSAKKTKRSTITSKDVVFLQLFVAASSSQILFPNEMTTYSRVVVRPFVGSGNLSQESKKSIHTGYKGANIPYKSLKFDC